MRERKRKREKERESERKRERERERETQVYDVFFKSFRFFSIHFESSTATRKSRLI